ncbi:hypothetical protein SAMN05216317_10510 [Nitrosomonas eutropha]|uniref:hypothetical protein n=1 Tax=Nitrosomonas TaxID=914 RepID=UPI000895E033|nr:MULTISPECIES: hypothetical protein [Nitrosomonas]MXS81073.1 hypothetical protein [Nitrosomonas sp. GH22]SDW36734.1 hypothetical protein SAMN05216317_10510 [Nitrosomonas eutropha]
MFTGSLDKLIFTVLFLMIGAGLMRVALASGARQDKIVNSQEITEEYSKPRQQVKSSVTATTSSPNKIDGSAGGQKRSTYRRIYSTDASRTLINPARLPADYCGVVEHIVPVMLNPANGGNTDTFISGIVAVPLGRHWGSFFTEVDVLGNSSYVPPERNIAEPIYYRISLLANDGNRYVITQQVPPGFQPGETIRFNDDGLLEKAGCVMREPDPHQPGR